MAPNVSSFLAISLALIAPVALRAMDQQGRHGAHLSTNPIRKVVNLLQSMQAQVEEEAKKEEASYEQFLCYCQNSGGQLSKTIEEAKTKIESLSSSLEAYTEKKSQAEEDLKEHIASRAEANEALSKASALREKEATSFASEESEIKANVAALAKAIPAIESGMSGAFLQTNAASTLRSFAIEKAELPDVTRQELIAFLSNSEDQGYAPQSNEIVGILKQMQEEMQKNLARAVAEEQVALANYGALKAAKAKEVDALTAQIEEEQTRVGQLGIDIASMGVDLEDTTESLGEDNKFLSELEGGCSTKTQEWKAAKQLRADELVALSETIKILNEDAALDLFKKTLPGSAASFVQVQVTVASTKARALRVLRVAQQRSHNGRLPSHSELNFILLALSSKTVGFEKVISLVDEMVGNLKAEQSEDDSKKNYCDVQLDIAEDKKKDLEHSLSVSGTLIAEMTGSLEKLTGEIAELEAGIRALDASVVESTSLRKAEHEEYSQLISDNAAAKEILLWAKNRLNKFYNPKLYKAPTDGDGTDNSVSFLQVSSHMGARGAPPPPPETFDAYTKKTEGEAGVIGMMDILIRDLDKQSTQAEAEEKNAQKEYEVLMAEAAKKRADDSKSITDKASAKAAEEEVLEAEINNKEGTAKGLTASLEYLHSLHGECDFLLKYYKVRKDARTGEIEALGEAKAVLSGADYSLLQEGSSVQSLGFLSLHRGAVLTE